MYGKVKWENLSDWRDDARLTFMRWWHLSIRNLCNNFISPSCLLTVILSFHKEESRTKKDGTRGKKWNKLNCDILLSSSSHPMREANKHNHFLLFACAKKLHSMSNEMFLLIVAVEHTHTNDIWRNHHHASIPLFKRMINSLKWSLYVFITLDDTTLKFDKSRSWNQ